jgi:hypothetical protein
MGLTAAVAVDLKHERNRVAAIACRPDLWPTKLTHLVQE